MISYPCIDRPSRTRKRNSLNSPRPKWGKGGGPTNSGFMPIAIYRVILNAFASRFHDELDIMGPALRSSPEGGEGHVDSTPAGSVTVFPPVLTLRRCGGLQRLQGGVRHPRRPTCGTEGVGSLSPPISTQQRISAWPSRRHDCPREDYEGNPRGSFPRFSAGLPLPCTHGQGGSNRHRGGSRIPRRCLGLPEPRELHDTRRGGPGWRGLAPKDPGRVESYNPVGF